MTGAAVRRWSFIAAGVIIAAYLLYAATGPGT